MEEGRRLLRRLLVVTCASLAALLALLTSAALADDIPRPPGAIDDRGYELVSPPAKGNNQVGPGIVPSSDWDGVMYSVIGGVPGTTSGQPQLIARRGPTGWQSRSILPPRDQMLAPDYLALIAAPDLSEVVAAAFLGFSGAQLATNEHLVRLDGQGGQTLVHTFPTFEGMSAVRVAASDDLSHLFADIEQRIAPSHTAATTDVYDFGTDPPTLVSTMPGTALAPACGVPGTNAGDLAAGFPTAASTVAQHWTSTDGRRLFFLTAGSACGGGSNLYVHDTTSRESTLISGPPLGGGADQGVRAFVGATPDGSLVTYVTRTTLDLADSSDSDDADADVYQYDVDASANTCLTCVVDHAAVKGDEAIVSEDGSHVYFDSTAQLLPQATPGADNVYAVRAGTLAFVGITTNEGLDASLNSNAGSEVSRDGRHLVFLSGFAQMDAISGRDNGGFDQFYLYDDADGTVTCVSCPAAGPATAAVDAPRASSNQLLRPDVRAMTDDGSMVFFTTRQALVPVDVNGGADIYEWHDGAVGLITDGVAQYPFGAEPYVFSVSPDGRDLLFNNLARLTPDAQDDATKIYDARIGGGFPPPPPPPPPCVGDPCRGSSSGTPPLQRAASESLRGIGNVRPSTSGHLVVARIDASQRRQLARTGRLVVAVRVTSPGRVSIVGQARIGGRVRRVLGASKVAHGAGTVRLVLRLTERGRAALVSSGHLRVVLGIGYSKARGTQRVVLSLNATRHGR